MKKMGYLSIVLFVVLFVSGCGITKNSTNTKTSTSTNTKVLTCSVFTKGNNMNIAGNSEYIFENDKLVRQKGEFMFKDITVDNLSTVWDSFKTQLTEQNKPVEEIGYKRSVKADDQNYTFSVIIEVDLKNISSEVMKKYGVNEDYKSKTYNEIKKEVTADGTASCK